MSAPKRARWPWLIALVFPLPVLLAALPQAQAQAPPERLALLVRDNAFQDAEALADSTAGPDGDAAHLAWRGLALLKAGRVEDAEPLLTRALALAPGSPEARYGAGRLARLRNDNAAAVLHLRAAVESATLYAEAARHYWRTVWDLGDLAALADARALIERRFAAAGEPVPSWLSNNVTQIAGLGGVRLFAMEAPRGLVTVPLHSDEVRHPRIRRVILRVNGKAEYPFDLDSASPDFLTISPLLAEDLGLAATGGSTASGVGTRTAAVSFAVLDRVDVGPITFRHVPVMVSDLQSFRGERRGLIGTGLLKRFNVTLDAGANVMCLAPLDQPDLLTGSLRPGSVVADVPLYLFDQTVVRAALDGTPPALYILDTAAATHLIDGGFSQAHLRPRTDASRVTTSGIRGAQGPQQTMRIDGVTVTLGPLALPGQGVHEFTMGMLNVIPGRYAAGLLGNPILWPYRVHLNFRAGRLVLERPSPPGA